jgi:hypothetical protein
MAEAIVALAASDPNVVVLYQVSNDRFRAEVLALHVLIEDIEPEWDRTTGERPLGVVRRLLLPVPLSSFKAGFDPGELAHLLADSFWECRIADTDSILSRLSNTFGCGPDCGWNTEQYTDDGSATDFLLTHGTACLVYEDDMEEDE